MDQQINEAVKVAIQIQSDRLRNEAQVENDEFLKTIDENTQKIIKEHVKKQVNVQVPKILSKIKQIVNEQREAEVLTQSSNSSKTSYVVAADLSKMELRKILIKKIEGNKSIQRSNEQRNLYKALVKAYESDMIILDTYRDTGFKRRREGKDLESASAPKKKATRSAGKLTQGSKSRQTLASESTTAEEPMQITFEMEEPSHLEFEIGVMQKPSEAQIFLKEVYKATTDQLEWVNLEGQQYPHNLLKPLPLISNSRGRHVIPFDHFINNDLEYLRGGTSSHKYTTSVTKTKAADYRHIKWIEDLVPRTIDGMLTDVRTALDDRLKDGEVKLVSEASIRRNLKLKDSDGITTLPNTEIFEQLALIGTYIAPSLTQKLFSNKRRASKGYTRVDIPLFLTMLIQGLILQGEGPRVPVECRHTPSGAPTTSQPPLSSRSRIPTRQETKVPHPSSPTHTNVADKAASIGVDVRHGGATTTASSLDAGQGSDNIDKIPSMPHDSPLLRVYTLRSDKGRMQHNELMDLVTKLTNKVLALDTDLQQTKKVYSTAFPKLIMKVKKLKKIVKSNKAKRKAKIVVSDDEDATEDSSKQGRKIDEIDQDPNISLVQHDAERSSSKDKAVRLQEQLDEEEMQRIARVHKEASLFIVEEWEDIQAAIEADKELELRIQAEKREKYSKAEKARLLDLVKKRFSTTKPTDDKEKELWVELKRLFKPDNDDTLWKLQRGNSSTRQWEYFFTSSGKIALAVGTLLHYQWELLLAVGTHH
nr:hypothetical protein [Tanacetum cinerariifolium]